MNKAWIALKNHTGLILSLLMGGMLSIPIYQTCIDWRNAIRWHDYLFIYLIPMVLFVAIGGFGTLIYLVIKSDSGNS